MRRFHDLSIKRKLTLIIMLASSIALLLACAALVAYDWLSAKQSLARRLEAIAEIVGLNSTAALIFDNAGDAAQTLSALRLEPDIVAACIYARDGRPFAIYARDGLDFAPPPVEADGHRFVRDHLLLFRSIELGSERLGAVYMVADLRQMRQRLARYAGIVALSVLVASLAAFLVGSRLRNLISAPILDLVEKMRLVATAQDYSVRAQKHGEDELGQLIEGFNAMLAQIRDRDQALQQARDELEKRARELQVELEERRRAEARIQASLEEKEILLKEIHHRVKNNLQVISSLLNLQATSIADERIAEMFRDSQNRINSMGLIHERLYQTGDLARIDLAQYIQDLAKNLFYSYAGESRNIGLHVRVGDVVLDVDASIPCGLIINELVSNSLKHAFPGGQGGDIYIDLHREADGQLLLSVRDNGVGLPPGLDYRSTLSLGLKLVNTLVRQLRGQLEGRGDQGTEFRIRFPARS
jgi:two-component sensor histidine kinase